MNFKPIYMDQKQRTINKSRPPAAFTPGLIIRCKCYFETLAPNETYSFKRLKVAGENLIAIMVRDK